MTGVEAASVLKAMLPPTKMILFSMYMNSVPRSLAAAIGVDLARSKSDGIAKSGVHLKTLLAPIAGILSMQKRVKSLLGIGFDGNRPTQIMDFRPRLPFVFHL